MTSGGVGRVPAGPARAHLLALLGAGVSLAAVSRLSEVPYSTLWFILKDAVAVAAGTAERVFTLTPEQCRAADGSFVDAAPVREHTLGLLGTGGGLTPYQFRRHLGIDAKTLRRILNPETSRVRRGVAERILAVQPGQIRPAAVHRASAEPAHAHIDALVAQRVTYIQIAQRAGVHESTVARVHRRASLVVEADTVEWLTGVPLSIAEQAPVDAGPVAEHLRTLQRGGMPRRQVAVIAGVGASTLRNIELGRTQSTRRDLADRIFAVQLEKAVSVSPWADLSAVTTHVQMLRECRMPVRVIAENAQVSASLVSRVIAGRAQRVTRAVGERVLAVTPMSARLGPNVKVPAVGSQRRVRALACMGWGTPQLAEMLGVTGLSVNNKVTVMKSTADQIESLYEALKDVRGPSPRTATLALNRGWFPPTHWEGLNIDDPAAEMSSAA